MSSYSLMLLGRPAFIVDKEIYVGEDTRTLFSSYKTKWEGKLIKNEKGDIQFIIDDKQI